MCGRFALFVGPEDLARAFGVTIEDMEIPARYNIAPTQPVAIVRRDPDRGRQIARVRWGFVPPWASEPGAGPNPINARNETAATGPMYRAAFRGARCLIPASGFYEWQATGRAKQPHFIRPPDGGLLAFAGLWARWAKPGWEPVESCTILTASANGTMRPIHDRMPVILDPGDLAVWLGETPAAPEALRALLRPAPDNRLTAYRVSPRVNNPTADDAGCIEPV